MFTHGSPGGGGGLKCQKVGGLVVFFEGYFLRPMVFLGCKFRARLQKLLKYSLGPSFVKFLSDTNMMKHKTLQKCT